MKTNPDTTLASLPERVGRIAEAVFTQRKDLRAAQDGLIQAYNAAVDVFEHGGILYLCGNGGSFADAIHIKGELAKSFTAPRPMTDATVVSRLAASAVGKKLAAGLEAGFPVVVLGESHSLRSAYANDRDAELIYAQEMNSFAGWIRHGVFLGISTSGNSRTVIAAMTLAAAYEMPTIAFTGPDGGEMGRLAKIAWRVPGETTHNIQENHIVLYHAWCRMIEAYYFGA
jgi:D-sedoheptulose 7-phosphate isomerase